MYENFGNFLLIIFTMKISSFTIKNQIFGRELKSRVRRRFRESRVRRRRASRASRASRAPHSSPSGRPSRTSRAAELKLVYLSESIPGDSSQCDRIPIRNPYPLETHPESVPTCLTHDRYVYVNGKCGCLGASPGFQKSIFTIF